MELEYWQSDRPNFGDDMNLWFWDRVVPGWREWGGDDSYLFGIGTILNHTSLSREGYCVVLGSGTGYGGAEQASAYPQVDFRFVRGPLTAKRMGLPADKGICDPSVLAPQVFAPGADHGGTLFVPHLATDALPLPWARWCAEMGVEYLSPTGDSEEVIRRISGARRVLAESMHAAITADAYRVPWVAVQLSPGFNEFKWRDWATSLDVEFTSVHQVAAVARLVKGLLQGRDGPVASRAAAPAAGRPEGAPEATPKPTTDPEQGAAPRYEQTLRRLSAPLGLVFKGVLWQALRRQSTLSGDAALERKQLLLRDALDRAAEVYLGARDSRKRSRRYG